MKFARLQGGYSLIEFSLVVSVLITAAVIGLQYVSTKADHASSRNLGEELYTVKAGVAQWIDANRNNHILIESLETEPTIREGVSWLKGASCGGTSDVAHIECNVLTANSGRTTIGGLQIATEISVSEGDLQAKIVVEELVIDGRRAREISGLAALVASGASSVTDMGSRYLDQVGQTIFCLTESSSRHCEGSEGSIISLVSGSPNPNTWLRSDIENMMNGPLHFNADSDATDNSGYSVRAVRNVARLYNIGDSGNDSLFLGSDGLSLPNSLANSGVVVDADQGILGELVVFGEARISGGNLSVLSSSGSGGNVIVSGRADVAGDLDGSRNMRSEQLHIRGDSGIYGTAFGSTRNNLSSQGIELTGIVDPIDSGLRLMPSGTSTLNEVEVEHLNASDELTLPLVRSFEEGDSCDQGSIGITEDGDIIRCQDQRWRISGQELSTVITGRLNDGEYTGYPSGYSLTQCQAAMSLSSGSFSESVYIDVTAEKASGAIRADCTTESGSAQCSYIILCNENPPSRQTVGGTLPSEGHWQQPVVEAYVTRSLTYGSIKAGTCYPIGSENRYVVESNTSANFERRVQTCE